MPFCKQFSNLCQYCVQRQPSIDVIVQILLGAFQRRYQTWIGLNTFENCHCFAATVDSTFENSAKYVGFIAAGRREIDTCYLVAF